MLEGDVGDLLRRGLDEADDGLLVVNPSQYGIRTFIHTLQNINPPSTVRLFADEEPLKELADDFLIASAMADLLATDVLNVRLLDPVPRNSLLLTEEFLVSLVEGNNQVGGLTTIEESFVTETYSYYADQWGNAEDFSLRTPALTHIRETLEDEIGSEAAADFDRILETLETARGNGEGLDEVTISLLVAAKNDKLLYDISRWGEDIGLASKATFSRTKNQLEEHGLLDTEKVPIDVGRPRLRLKFADAQLEDATAEELAARTQSKLA